VDVNGKQVVGESIIKGPCRQNWKEECACAWHATLLSDFRGYIFANLLDFGD